MQQTSKCDKFKVLLSKSAQLGSLHASFCFWDAHFIYENSFVQDMTAL